MKIEPENSESPLITFFVIPLERDPNSVRASGLRRRQTWGFHYMHDYLIDSKNILQVIAIAKLLAIELNRNAQDDLLVFNTYLDSMYPTYSYH